MSDSTSELIEEFHELIKDAEVFRYITRDSELQVSARKNLEELRLRILRLKSGAISEGNEEFANQLLGYSCVVDILIAEIEMWLLLKREEPDEAWEKLVVAQRLSSAAARTHEGFGHLVHHHQRLVLLEKLLFPPQVFVSAGMTIKYQECSICGEEYEDCEHLKGMPYMGKFCNVVIHDFELDHVGIVESPADKSCRIKEVDLAEGVRNRMTWRVETKTRPEVTAPEEELKFRATILRPGFRE